MGNLMANLMGLPVETSLRRIASIGLEADKHGARCITGPVHNATLPVRSAAQCPARRRVYSAAPHNLYLPRLSTIFRQSSLSLSF